MRIADAQKPAQPTAEVRDPLVVGLAEGSGTAGAELDIILLFEMATLLGMGWLIRKVAATNGLRLDHDEAYLLATIAPVPLWVSSLGLLVPSLGFNVLLSLTALALSCGIIYHGIQALCHTREGVAAAAIAQTVIGAGLIAWALLLLLVVVL